jgi:hypothetical protein
MLYAEALGQKEQDGWRSMVPTSVVKIIGENWDVVKKFAQSEEATTRVMGMKFPQQGYK